MNGSFRRTLPHALLVALAAACGTARAPDPPASVAGAPASARRLPSLSFAKLGGPGEVSLDALRGKTVLLDVWASWCPPCKEELPRLDDLAKRLAAEGVPAVIVAVSVDEDRRDAEAFLASRPAWALTLGHDPTQKLPAQLEPPKMPTSFLVDRTGIVREVIAGYEAKDFPGIEARLRALAASN